MTVLSETRVKGQGQLSEQHYTFFWSGGDLHQAGAAFAIHKDVLTRLAAAPSALSNRLSSFGIRLAEKRFLVVYAPTMTYVDATRANFTRTKLTSLSSSATVMRAWEATVQVGVGCGNPRQLAVGTLY